MESREKIVSRAKRQLNPIYAMLQVHRVKSIYRN